MQIPDKGGGASSASLSPLIMGLVGACLVFAVALGSAHRPAVSDREVVAPAAAAAAPESPPTDDGGGNGEVGNVITILILGALAVVLALIVSPRRVAWAIAGLVGLLAVVYLLIPKGGEMPVAESAAALSEPEPSVRQRNTGRDAPLSTELLVAFAASSLAVIGVYLWRRRATERSDEVADADLPEIVRRSLADLDTITDHRQAVVSAYARLEAALGDAGLERHRDETSREYVTRVFRGVDVHPEAIEALGVRYEHARFDPAPVTIDDRTRAVEALRRIQRELVDAQRSMVVT